MRGSIHTEPTSPLLWRSKQQQGQDCDPQPGGGIKPPSKVHSATAVAGSVSQQPVETEVEADRQYFIERNTRRWVWFRTAEVPFRFFLRLILQIV